MVVKAQRGGHAHEEAGPSVIPTSIRHSLQAHSQMPFNLSVMACHIFQRTQADTAC